MILYRNQRSFKTLAEWEQMGRYMISLRYKLYFHYFELILSTLTANWERRMEEWTLVFKNCQQCTSLLFNSIPRNEHLANIREPSSRNLGMKKPLVFNQTNILNWLSRKAANIFSTTIFAVWVPHEKNVQISSTSITLESFIKDFFLIYKRNSFNHKSQRILFSCHTLSDVKSIK